MTDGDIVVAALRAGKLAEARRLWSRLSPGAPVTVHLDAVLCWQEGAVDAARARFANALSARPRAADWLADAADFEAAQGMTDTAAALFRQSIAADPGPAALPRRLRLALALLAGDRVEAAMDELERLVADAPGSPSAWQALGAARRAAGDAVEAAAAFDAVLRLRPADPLARLSRAQMRADRGQPSVDAFRDALAADPASSAARTGLAGALAGARNLSAAERVLRERLVREPGWQDGWAALCSLMQRWRGRPAFRAVASEALAAAPHPAAALSALRLLARAGEHRAVLDTVPAVRARWGASAPLTLIEAEALDEVGNAPAAAALLEALAKVTDPSAVLARVRHALRTGRADAAAILAETLLGTPAAALAWPYLGTAWRLTGDGRHAWLEGDARLVGHLDLGLAAAEIAAVADVLRQLHVSVEAPFEQSMRGGTQTEGLLLSRDEPELRRLRAALDAAVRVHLDRLPPRDPAHPVLAPPRDRVRFVGSWSVRLTGGGFHVNHVHGDGWYSSACHLVLPDAAPGDGLLTLGEPPRELALGLEPLRRLTPRPGWLALFPSIMWHGTTPFAAGERLSVAFDLKSSR